MSVMRRRLCVAGALSGAAALMLAAGLSPAGDVAQASDDGGIRMRPPTEVERFSAAPSSASRPALPIGVPALRVVNEHSLALGYVSPRSVYWIAPEANSPLDESIYRQWIGIDLASNRTCDQRSTIGGS